MKDSASIKDALDHGFILADAVLDAVDRDFQLLEIELSAKLYIHV